MLNKKIPVGGQFDISVVSHLPQARREVTFTPMPVDVQPTDAEEAAVLVDLSVDGEQRELWLSRSDGEFGLQTVYTPRGFVAVTFGYQQLPLGFTIELQKFHRSVNPGRTGDAAITSTIQLRETAEGTPLSGEIALNEPLTRGKFTFYQSSFQELPGNVQVSVLTAAHDPGRFCKYFGSLMICGGIFLTFAMRSKMFSPVAVLGKRRQVNSDAEHDPPALLESTESAVPPPLGLFRTKTDSVRTLREPPGNLPCTDTLSRQLSSCCPA